MPVTYIDDAKQLESAVRQNRQARLVSGTLRLDDGATVPLIVRNLSARGLGVRCLGTPPAMNQPVIITLPGSPELDGVIRWESGADLGVELSDTVDLPALAVAIRNEIARLHKAPDFVVKPQHRVRAPQLSGPRRAI